MADTPAERIKELHKKRAKTLDTAKKEALTRALQAVADLTSLGFTYTLVDDTAKPAKVSAPSRKRTMTVRDTVVEAAERGLLATGPRKSFASHLMSIPSGVEFKRIRGTVRDIDL